MDVFEFILILVTVVTGLGMAELLGGVVRILRQELEPGRLHWLWVWLTFEAQVEWLWSSWNYRDRAEWLFPEFILLLSVPVVLYMAAAVLFPKTNIGDDLDAHYFRSRRPFFLLLIALVVLFGLNHQFLGSGDFWDVPSLIKLVLILAFSVLALTTNRRVHWGVALGILGVQLWWVYQYSFVI